MAQPADFEQLLGSKIKGLTIYKRETEVQVPWPVLDLTAGR